MSFQMPSTLMIQGTTSDAGKSALVAGICRVLHRKGIKVAPFKPQNMALNSAVTSEGGEIGRAQALQARACGLDPHTDMNPVLIKPNTDVGAQIIINGQAIGNMDALDYHEYKQTAMQAVLDAHQRLSEKYEVIVVEGAGSPAEINLRDKDIANMGFAEAVDCPVILVSDIDRGGVFAHIVGTLELLSESEQARVAGFVINKFRGDIALLRSGLDWLEARTNKPVLGVLPYLHHLYLDAEDSINSSDLNSSDNNSSNPVETAQSRCKIIVPVLPRISNHTDFDPLRVHPQVELEYIHIEDSPPPADLIILPGSKNVCADLALLKKHNWPEKINRHLRYGGKLLGICGGFQMLGRTIHDPDGIEDQTGSSEALGLLDFESTLQKQKTLRNVEGTILSDNSTFTGYEIHAGISQGEALANPFSEVNGKQDGVVSDDGQIIGTYFHGLFEKSEALQSILNWVGFKLEVTQDYNQVREKAIERMADAIEENINLSIL